MLALAEEIRVKWLKKCDELKQGPLASFLLSRAHPFRFDRRTNQDMIDALLFENGEFSEAKLDGLRKQVSHYEQQGWLRRLWARLRHGLGKKRSLLRVVEWERALATLKEHISHPRDANTEDKNSVIPAATSLARGEENDSLEAAITRLNESTKRIQELGRWARFRRSLKPKLLEDELALLQKELISLVPTITPSMSLNGDTLEPLRKQEVSPPLVSVSVSKDTTSNQVLLDSWVEEQREVLGRTVLSGQPLNLGESNSLPVDYLQTRWEEDKKALIGLWKMTLSFFRYFVPMRLKQIGDNETMLVLILGDKREEFLNRKGFLVLLREVNLALNKRYHPDRNYKNKEMADKVFKDMQSFVEAVEGLRGVVFGEKKADELSPELESTLVLNGILKDSNELFREVETENYSRAYEWLRESSRQEQEELEELRQSYVELTAQARRATQIWDAVSAKQDVIDALQDATEARQKATEELLGSTEKMCDEVRAGIRQLTAMTEESSRRWKEAFSEEAIKKMIKESLAASASTGRDRSESSEAGASASAEADEPEQRSGSPRFRSGKS